MFMECAMGLSCFLWAHIVIVAAHFHSRALFFFIKFIDSNTFRMIISQKLNMIMFLVAIMQQMQQTFL